MTFLDSLIQKHLLPFRQKQHLPVIHQSDRHKEKRKGSRYVFSGLFGKCEVVPCPDLLQQIYKEGDVVDIKGTGTVQQNWKSPCYPACCRHCWKQVKGKIPAKRINVRIDSIKRAKSWGGFLKGMKENDQKKKDSTEAPACSWWRSTPVRTNGKEPEPLEPVSYEFMA